MMKVKFKFKSDDNSVFSIEGIAKVRQNSERSSNTAKPSSEQSRERSSKTANSDTVYLNLGVAGDEFPCIMIEYDKINKICKVSKLRAQKFGGWTRDERVLCTTPPLPSKGALDILVHISLAIIRKYIGKVKTYINDGAMVDNKYPLSWKKFWLGKGTTYSKYGFRIRSGSPDFNKYMKETRVKLSRKMPGTNMTYEKYIKFLLNKRIKYDPEFERDDLKALDIRGIWFMDWNYYDKLPKFKIIETKISDIGR